jgi:hypothetical protein
MIFESYVKENKAEFLSKLIKIAALLGFDPNWLMAVMWSESRLNHRAVNPNGNATGLIQFMPSTAKDLGTSVEALKAMSNVQQLDYVYKYFKGLKNKAKSFTDLYMYTFFPVALNKPDDFVLQTKNLSARRIALANPGFDLNKDFQITVGEFKLAILKRLPAEIAELFKKKV